MIACKYKCLQCHYEWTLPNPKASNCLSCGHVYVQWLNYDAWLKAPGKTPEFIKAHYG